MNVVMLAEVSAERVIGGAERVLRQQSLGLAAAGHRVQVLARAPEGAVEDAIMVGGIRERRYAVNRAHEAAFVWSSVRQSAAVFDRMRQTEPVDAVVVHQALAALGPLLFHRHAAARWIYVCHSLAHEEFATRQLGDLRGVRRMRRRMNGYARRWVERAVIARCDQVVVLSEYMRRRVMEVHRMPGDAVTVIPGATDPHLFQPVSDRRAVRRALGLPDDRTLLFTVRNLVPRMGLDNLLEALERSTLARARCTLVIGGEGPLRAELEAGVRRRGLDDIVRLVGFVPEEDLPRYYQAADAVIMPTRHLEGFGLVTVEALACGTPVLGTPVGAIPEILTQIDPALVTNGTDGRALAEGLDRLLPLLHQPEECRRLMARGRMLVEERYNWGAHCADLTALLACPMEKRKAA
jgi:glycosyltransferase involved in cell wall biosynthesis